MSAIHHLGLRTATLAAATPSFASDVTSHCFPRLEWRQCHMFCPPRYELVSCQGACRVVAVGGHVT